MPDLHLTWGRTGDRQSWTAVHAGAVLIVSRTAYGWRAEVCWDRGTSAETSEFSGYFRTRTLAQGWAERRVRP
jgi:hypothetical protein